MLWIRWGGPLLRHSSKPSDSATGAEWGGDIAFPFIFVSTYIFMGWPFWANNTANIFGTRGITKAGAFFV